jgi:hypothetical protein
MRGLLIAVVITLTSAQARADADDDVKSASTATWLSAGGTAAAYLGVAESTRITDTTPSGATRTLVIGADIAAVLALPALGHFYADDWHPTGLAIRAAGLVAIALGAYSDRSCEDEPCGGTALILVGGLAVVTGTIYDIATAGGAAHEYNRAHHVSITPTVLNPPSGPVMGIGVGGEF